MAVPRFHKFVRRFGQDVQRCRGGFSTLAHVYTRTHTPQDGCRSPSEDFTRLQDSFVTPSYVCATFESDCNPAVYVFLYMLPISMFSEQKYNILIQ